MSNFTYTGVKFIQGDVNLRQITELPKGELFPVDKNYVQESETLGKAHKFAMDADVQVFSMSEIPKGGTITPDMTKLVLVGEDGATMFHGKSFDLMPNSDNGTDHSALAIPPGTYHVSIANEWDYDKNEQTKVVD